MFHSSVYARKTLLPVPPLTSDPTYPKILFPTVIPGEEDSYLI